MTHQSNKDLNWHKQQAEMYNRTLPKWKPSQSVTNMSMLVYHERMIRELTNPTK